MPDLSLDLRYLKYALAAAQHQSFRRAAAALNVSQSTLVRRVQLLEHRIGFRIFDRGRGGVRLTSAGCIFLEEASVGMHQAIQVASSVERGERGELQVGVLLPLATGPIHSVLREFHRRYPHVRVSLHDGTSQQDLARVMTGELDISFIAGQPRLTGQDALLVWEEGIHVAMPTDHRLVNSGEVSWQDLKEETWVVSQRGTGPEVRDYLIRKLAKPGVRPTIEVHDVGRHDLLNIVAMGYGITPVSASVANSLIEGIKFRPIGNDPEQLPWVAVWSPANSNPALRYFLRLVRDMAAGRMGQAGLLRFALAVTASCKTEAASSLLDFVGASGWLIYFG